MCGGMEGFRGDSDDGREQGHARVTKVLGIVQFVLGVAVICARVAELGECRKGRGLLGKKGLPTRSFSESQPAFEIMMLTHC